MTTKSMPEEHTRWARRMNALMRDSTLEGTEQWADIDREPTRVARQKALYHLLTKEMDFENWIMIPQGLKPPTQEIARRLYGIARAWERKDEAAEVWMNGVLNNSRYVNAHNAEGTLLDAWTWEQAGFEVSYIYDSMVHQLGEFEAMIDFLLRNRVFKDPGNMWFFIWGIRGNRFLTSAEEWRLVWRMTANKVAKHFLPAPERYERDFMERRRLIPSVRRRTSTARLAREPTEEDEQRFSRSVRRGRYNSN